MSEHDRCEAEIRRLGAEVQASAARAVEEAKRYAADLEWARGAVDRLRDAVASGYSTLAQADALNYASWVASTSEGGASTRELAAAFLALHEEHKATRAELARVIGMGPAL